MAEQMLSSTSSSQAGWAALAGPQQVKRLHHTQQSVPHRCCWGWSHGHHRAWRRMEGDAQMMEGDGRNEHLQTRGPKMLHSQSLPFPETRPAAQRAVPKKMHPPQAGATLHTGLAVCSGRLWQQPMGCQCKGQDGMVKAAWGG